MEADVGTDESSSLTSREDEVVIWCSEKTWRVNYYDDAAHTNLVGWISCVCYRQQQDWGTPTIYQQVVYDYVCDFN